MLRRGDGVWQCPGVRARRGTGRIPQPGRMERPRRKPARLGESGPGEPQTPCVWAVGQSPWGAGAADVGLWVAGAVPPWLWLSLVTRSLRKGGGAALPASCTASSLQFMDSLEVCKTLCQHQSVCVNQTIYLCTSASLLASFTHLKLKWDQQDCAAHPSTHVRPAHSP